MTKQLPNPDAVPLLHVQNLGVAHDGPAGSITALAGISFKLEAGETLAVIGESGSGKSLTASVIMGLLANATTRVTEGQVWFEGENILQLAPEARRALNGSRIGMVFQDPLSAFNPVMSVDAQIMEALLQHGGRKQARSEALALMQRVGIEAPERRMRAFPHQFSGGQRQRLMIAMAIAQKPSLLIADEPTSALDATVQAQIIELLQGIQSEQRMGMLFITHDIALAARIADKIAVMHQGRIVEAGATQDVLGNPASAYTRMLLASVPGRGLPADSATPAEAMLAVRNLAKSYPIARSSLFERKRRRKQALRGVDFVLGKNEVVCVVGESGSGKSTLVSTLLGLQQADEGEISLHGKRIDRHDSAQMSRFRRSVQTIFQDPAASVDPLMTVEQIISQPLLRMAEFHSRALRQAEVSRLLLAVGLPAGFAGRYPNQLSGGQLQRIAIARALASQPEVLIADEAVSALDACVQSRIIQLLLTLKRQSSLALLFVTHDLALVRDFADRVLVMWDGSIVEQGSAYQVFTNPQHPYTRELLRNAQYKVTEEGGHATACK